MSWTSHFAGNTCPCRSRQHPGLLQPLHAGRAESGQVLSPCRAFAACVRRFHGRPWNVCWLVGTSCLDRGNEGNEPPAGPGTFCLGNGCRGKETGRQIVPGGWRLGVVRAACRTNITPSCSNRFTRTEQNRGITTRLHKAHQETDHPPRKGPQNQGQIVPTGEKTWPDQGDRPPKQHHPVLLISRHADRAESGYAGVP